MQKIQIIIEPIITEKTLTLAQNGMYTFKVHPKSNKPEIAIAIQDLYKVNCVSVNVINKKSEAKTIRGRFKYNTKSYKKAVIKLKKDQKIPGYGLEEKKDKKDKNAKAKNS